MNITYENKNKINLLILILTYKKVWNIESTNTIKQTQIFIKEKTLTININNFCSQ